MDNLDRAKMAEPVPTIKRDTSTRAGLIREVDTLRRHGGWYTLVCLTEGRDIQIKGYGTWLQVYKGDGGDWSGMMDIPVARFKDRLREPFVTKGGSDA
mgnify:CR=1 FL=1